MTDHPCYGIDLGTTCSAIGVVDGSGSPRLFEIDGDVLVPSVVSFPEGRPPLVGAPARNRLPLDPLRTIRSAKRHIGTDHRWAIGEREIDPVAVSALLIGRLLDGVEASGAARPRRAVITVPAWFRLLQRADTRRGGEAAGLAVERIINEPTAAALAHAQGQDLSRRMVVYDLGGGTFDVSVVEQDGPLLEVRASHGDSRLGGDDIDLAFTDHVLRRLAAEQPDLRAAIDGAPAARVRLRAAVEEAKIALSERRHVTLRVPFLVDGPGGALHLELPLVREELLEVAAPWIEKTLPSVETALADAGLGASEIDELVLVGGATQMPLVWSSLADATGLEGSYAIPPRIAVALGAAIQGAIIDGSRVHGVLVDVAPYSLSAGTLTGPFPGMMTHFVCKVITPRNAPLPARHTELFHTGHPTQDAVKVPIFQGSSPDPRRNTLLGMIEIDGLEPAPPGRSVRPIGVELRHDLDGMVSVTVTEELSGKSGRARMTVDQAAHAGLWAEVVDGLDGLILGDGSDPEPPPQAADPSEVAEDYVTPQGDLAEAREIFKAVLAAEVSLGADHPAHAAALLSLAREGMAAADTEEAMARYDALSDLMFEEGIFL